MANLLESSQNKETIAPDYYKSALSTIATCGKKAMEAGKFIGATPLQQQAFGNAAANVGAAKPTLTESGAVTGQAADVNVTGAANPYLQSAFTGNPAALAQCYMSPYIQNAVQGMSNIGMRNIQQNLTPQATAAAVGSGQYGSQRGAQVLGQVQSNAMNDLNAQIAGMQNTGYSNALQAATARQALLNQLGSTAAGAASQCASAKNVAGANLANLGRTMSDVNIACTELLSKMGAECQTIKQNEQCYALSKMCKYATMLGKNQVPTTVKTTMCMSPLSTAAAVGSGVAGAIQKAPGIIESLCKGYTAIKNLGKSPVISTAAKSIGTMGQKKASGGLVKNQNNGNAMGCASLRNYGGLPCRR